jgi:hypothetical protein
MLGSVARSAMWARSPMGVRGARSPSAAWPRSATYSKFCASSTRLCGEATSADSTWALAVPLLLL